MKILLALFTIVALTSGFEFKQRLDATEFSISSQIVEAIEDAKLQMPCGFPAWGIPPLAPLRIEYKEVELAGEDFLLAGDVDNARIDGINEFDIVEFKVSPIFSRCNFKFVWNHLHLNTVYDMLLKKGQRDMKRNGIANIDLKGLAIWGQIKYKLGVIGGQFQVKEFKVYASLAEVQSQIEGLMKNKYLNRLVNQMIEEWIMLAINDNTENMAKISDQVVVPMLNNMIGDKSLADIIGILGGGSGGEEKPEKKECIPPEDI